MSTIREYISSKGALFFKIIYLKHIRGQMNKYWITFHVPVGCAKLTSCVQSDSDKPTKAYQQHDQKRSCFSILASALKTSNHMSSENLLATRSSSVITDKILERVMFINSIMTDIKRRK